MATDPARLQGGFAESDSQIQKRITVCPSPDLQPATREAGSPVHHFPGSFSLRRD